MKEIAPLRAENGQPPITGDAEINGVFSVLNTYPACLHRLKVQWIAGALCFLFANSHAQTPFLAPFTRVTNGIIATEVLQSTPVAWGDYDGDGWLDLFVGNVGSGFNSLFHNRGDGTFEKITTGPIPRGPASDDAHGAAWVDYDNDGKPDLMVVNLFSSNNPLYHNLGGGNFSRMTSAQVGSIATDVGVSVGVAWADYDRDGYLDVFIANGALFSDEVDFLFHNKGNGQFARVTENPIVTPASSSTQGTWSDFDNDGDMDLLVTHSQDEGNTLFRNDGNGHFTDVTTMAGLVDEGDSVGATWGDFDNDGDLDLFITNFNLGKPNTRNFFYTNNGDGTFTLITNGVIASDFGHFLSCAWVDYDNDGWLDLFLTVDPPKGTTTNSVKNRLYHNQGDGTFQQVTEGALVTDNANPAGCAWGDYDNDGFLDVFVANGALTGPQRNGLYHNNGNSNSWLKIKCVGIVSNRSAIGTKVRAKATIGGRELWQMRQIVGTEGWLSFNALDVVIGFGDATVIDILRVEWPSGIVDEFHNVPVRQSLTIEEGTTSKRPSLTVTKDAAGQSSLAWPAGAAGFVLESADDLAQPNWQPVQGVVGNGYKLATSGQRFFRLHHP